MQFLRLCLILGIVRVRVVLKPFVDGWKQVGRSLLSNHRYKDVRAEYRSVSACEVRFESEGLRGKTTSANHILRAICWIHQAMEVPFGNRHNQTALNWTRIPVSNNERQSRCAIPRIAVQPRPYPNRQNRQLPGVMTIAVEHPKIIKQTDKYMIPHML